MALGDNSKDKITNGPTGTDFEPAFRPVTQETLTAVEPPGLPNSRYPRSSAENANNRFYVPDPSTAGDMRPMVAKGECFPPQRPNEKAPEHAAGATWQTEGSKQ
jgi:hypothetical protein